MQGDDIAVLLIDDTAIHIVCVPESCRWQLLEVLGRVPPRKQAVRLEEIIKNEDDEYEHLRGNVEKLNDIVAQQ